MFSSDIVEGMVSLVGDGSLMADHFTGMLSGHHFMFRRKGTWLFSWYRASQVNQYSYVSAWTPLSSGLVGRALRSNTMTSQRDAEPSRTCSVCECINLSSKACYIT